jgi:hypothetical protein
MQLARCIRAGGVVRLAWPPPEVIEAAPLDAVTVLSGEGAVDLRVVGETLEITGGGDARARLAASVANLARDEAFGRGVVARHIDVEYFPGHGFLSERAAWMTVTLLATPGR